MKATRWLNKKKSKKKRYETIHSRFRQLVSWRHLSFSQTQGEAIKKHNFEDFSRHHNVRTAWKYTELDTTAEVEPCSFLLKLLCGAWSQKEKFELPRSSTRALCQLNSGLAAGLTWVEIILFDLAALLDFSKCYLTKNKTLYEGCAAKTTEQRKTAWWKVTGFSLKLAVWNFCRPLQASS